jgi:uncharacterized membrane protein YeaQ/YmgE (transglycosylase-associated protein family)
MGVLLWIIIIGFVAGIIARLLVQGPNKPKGFLLTTVLGIAGALLATYIGQAIGLYRPGGSDGDPRPRHLADRPCKGLSCWSELRWRLDSIRSLKPAQKTAACQSAR